MAENEPLNSDPSDLDSASIFYRPVQSKERLREPDEQVINSPSELRDVQELLRYIQDKKLNYPMPVSDSKMSEITGDRVRKIFESQAENHFVTDILGLFCSNLEGRQKSQDKFAMLIYLNDRYLLAHAKAERGMSLRESVGEDDVRQIELIKRFLDVDNILSAALFEKNVDEIVFSHFTDSGSDSFREFLGVNEHRLNYRRKTIQIVCYYRSRREYSCKFEFTTDEFSDKWLRDNEIEFSGDKLRFQSDGGDRSHEIKEIRWGNTTYDSVERFKSEFKEETLGLNVDKDKYETLHSFPDGGAEKLSVFDAAKVVDRRRQIIIHKEDGSTEALNKNNTPDNLHVLYASSNILLDSGFADDIFADIINKNDVKIYHASEHPAARALSLGSITFLNIEDEKISPEMSKFLEETYSHAVNRAGETVRKCLLNSMFHVLREQVKPSIGNAFGQIINIYTGNPANGATVSTKENEAGNLVEYKNKIHLEGEDPAEDIFEEIKTEQRKGIHTKVFMWGFTEQNREVDGFSSQSWNDDRISGIEKAVLSRLSDEGLGHKEFMMQPVPLDNRGDRMAITGVFF
ncbi:hypothetical protein [Halomicrococcus sp. SG-WS-1]|uniref:hypothetical protein n=1 Tax=Halomicrococcus sp. SG-WS-1 TaxID=3439057 RepID=UPI003F7987AF